MPTIPLECPVAHDMQPLDAAFLDDPFAYFAAKRRESPVFYVPDIDLYFVTRYFDAEQIFLRPDTFGAGNASSPIWPPCEAAAKILTQVPRVPTLNNADQPRHGPMRTAVLKCMTPRRIAAMEPALRSVTRELVAALAAKPVADLVEDLTFPLPGYAAFTLLGFPVEDWELLKSWCGKRVQLTYGRLPEHEQVNVAETVLKFWRYCESYVTARERDPEDDFTSDLIAYAAQRPDEVTHADIVNIVYSMALAGHDSTSAALSSGLRRLLAERAAWEEVVATPSLGANAVEEMMRFDPPLLGHRRVALRDTEIGGIPIPKGAKLYLAFVSAHRDEARFNEADVFDVHRPDSRAHLSFGKGVHLCIGAPLARLEMKIVLELLAELTPAIRLAEQQIEMIPNLFTRNLQRLTVITGNR